MLSQVNSIDYEKMFMKQKKDATGKDRPMLQALKSEHAAVEMMAEESKFNGLSEED
jgi:hypothetical protein